MSEDLGELLGRYAAEPMVYSEFSLHTRERLGPTEDLIHLCGVETG
jgi:hypothetical protein